MIERLLLDRIDLQRRRRSVSQTVELSALIHPDETKAGLPFSNMAISRAKIAVHATIRRRLPPSPFVQRFRLLQYFQFIHGGLRKGKLLSCFESICPKYTPLGTMPIGQEGAVISNLKFPISNILKSRRDDIPEPTAPAEGKCADRDE